MQQLRLPMLTVYAGPRLVDRELVTACRSYREAVRACWEMGKRSRPALTQRQLAEEADLYPPHVSDYLSLKANKRDLPAAAINKFELALGNRMVSQWQASQAGLPVLDAAFMEHLARLQRAAA